MTITFQGARAFRHRNYRLFFGGQAISLVGTWMQQVAQGWLVLQLTHDPLWLGLVALAQFGPVILFGLFGGVIADQLPKRQTLMATQTVAMVLAFVLFGLTATGVVEVWHVMVLGGPARDRERGRHAGPPGVRGRDGRPRRRRERGRAQLPRCSTRSRILGPAAAGLLIGAFDISIAFLINGLSFIAVIVELRAGCAIASCARSPLSPRPTTWAGVIENLTRGRPIRPGDAARPARRPRSSGWRRRSA